MRNVTASEFTHVSGGKDDPQKSDSFFSGLARELIKEYGKEEAKRIFEWLKDQFNTAKTRQENLERMLALDPLDANDARNQQNLREAARTYSEENPINWQSGANIRGPVPRWDVAMLRSV